MSRDTRSHGLWAASAPGAPACEPLREQGVHADVAIVGGGYTGLSAALHLAAQGARAVLLEGEEFGFGGSGRNVGLVNAGLWVMPEALRQALGQTHGQRLLALLGDAPELVYSLAQRHGMDCQAVRHGTLHCAVGPTGLREIQERHRQWRALDAPVELLDAGQIAAATGTSVYTGGLLDRRAGTIQPLAYARGLAHAALAAGARLHVHSRVLAVEDHQRYWRLCTASGSVHADWVLVATETCSAANGPWPGLSRELVRLPYFNFATEPLDAVARGRILPNLQGVWDTRTILSSYRLDAKGRLVFGSVGALRGAGLKIHRDWAHRALARLYPALTGVRFEHEWYGHIGMTADAMPRLHLHGRNTVSVSGYNGRGIAPGTVFGRELANYVAGRTRIDDMALPVAPVVPVACKPLREGYYEMGARFAHLVSARL